MSNITIAHPLIWIHLLTMVVLFWYFIETCQSKTAVGGSPRSSGDLTGLATGRSAVKIPLEVEKFSPFRFFFWREPLNPSLPSERTFKHLPRKWLLFKQISHGSLCKSRRWWVLSMVSRGRKVVLE